jgi:hypothetical protein
MEPRENVLPELDDDLLLESMRPLVLSGAEDVALSDYRRAVWPAPGFTDTELGVLMEPEVCHGATEVYARVQA